MYMDTMMMNRFDSLTFDKLSEIVGGNVSYDIGYGVGQVSYIAVEILKLRKIRQYIGKYLCL